MSRFVYADNAATTSVSPEVLSAMLPYFGSEYGNPSSLYSLGRKSAEAIAEAREKIASLLGAKPNEIFFTSCGSESDNWAIKGAAHANISKGKHIISTVYEHHAVLHTLDALKKDGFEVTLLEVDSEGLITPEQLEAAIRPDTILVAMMYANNEIGTILPIKELAAVAHAHKVPFFTDAVQAVGNIPVNVADLGVDMLSLSGHKIHAPKGVGALYVKTGTRLHNLIDGGGQERRRRGGTENVAYIVGLAKALEIAIEQLPDMERVKKMRDRLASEISKIPATRINGSMEHRLPGNLNVAFEFIEGESLILLLDMAGIAASTGSACSTASLEPSHVLLSIGLPHEKAHGSLRLTLSHENTDEDVDYILEKLPPIVARLREMSPLYNN
ncbi:MAG: cysteine desulfurase NifS [Clostridia bacterium]|nr:cysteine desulfurase NifS [Clostridia bacterium]